MPAGQAYTHVVKPVCWILPFILLHSRSFHPAAFSSFTMYLYSVPPSYSHPQIFTIWTVLEYEILAHGFVFHLLWHTSGFFFFRVSWKKTLKVSHNWERYHSITVYHILYSSWGIIYDTHPGQNSLGHTNVLLQHNNTWPHIAPYTVTTIKDMQFECLLHLSKCQVGGKAFQCYGWISC